MKRPLGLCLLVLVALSACKVDPRDDDIASTTAPADDTTTGAAEGPPDPPPGTTDAGSTSAVVDDDTGVDDGTKLDLGPTPDAGTPIVCDVAEIPATCAEAALCPSTVGCEFFGVDLDQLDAADLNQFAISVSNVQLAGPARVTVGRKVGGVWDVVAGPVDLDPLQQHTFLLDDLHQEESGVKAGGAYWVIADAPIVAYQFNPLSQEGTASSSDASVLYPVTSWDSINHVVGWMPQGTSGTYVTVAAAFDGTTVEIIPSTATLSGPGVPAAAAGEAFLIELDAGDVVEVMTKTAGETLSGTRVTSDDDHPVAVFSGTECTFVVAYSCDHTEIQLSGVRRWGLEYVAARLAPRTDPPETTVWQIHASENNTTVSFEASGAVTGVPTDPVVLDGGETLVLEVGGTTADPGDFYVAANRPIAVVNYMTGSSLADSRGDPAMVQVPPAEQFLSRYVVLVPVSWDDDVAIITRPQGVSVRIDSIPVPQSAFIAVGAEWEVARVPVADGVHTLEGEAPFGVSIMGTTDVDSYAYVGGIGTEIINPAPQG